MISRPGNTNSGRTILKILLIAAAYTLVAKLGSLTMGEIDQLVWLPSGLALAALIIYGGQCWPGVALGSLLANLEPGIPPIFLIFVVAGNTLSASASAWVLTRVRSFSPVLQRGRDVQSLVLYGYFMGAAISALVGAAGWTLAGLSSWNQFIFDLFTWWFADASGILVLTPPLLVWLRKPRLPLRLETRREEAVLFGLLAAVSFFIFTSWGLPIHTISLPYILFPFTVWAAVRMGPPSAVMTVWVGNLVAIWGTSNGYGPFVLAGEQINFLYLHVFIGTLSVTSLLLAAVIAERSQARSDLLHSQLRFQGLFEDNPIGLLQTTPTGTILDCNLAAVEMSGYPHKAALLVENIVNLYADPSERTRVVETLQREKGLKNFELRLRSYDGSIIWAMFSARKREDADRGTFFEVAIQDISPRKQAQEALKLQLEENRRLLNEANLRARELGALVSLSKTLRKAQSPGDIYLLLAEQTRDIFAAGSVYIYRLENDVLTLGACSGCENLGHDERIPRLPGHLFWQTLDTCCTQTGFYRQAGAVEVCRMVAPLQTATQLIGILGVEGLLGAASFSQQDLHLLTGIAEIAGNALQRASIMDTLEKRVVERTRQLRALYGITSIASEALDLKEVLERSLEELLFAMGSKLGAIYLSEEGMEELSQIAVEGNLTGDLHQLSNRTRDQDALWRWAVAQAEPVLIPDLGLDQRISLNVRELTGCAFVAAPLKHNNRVIGTAGVFGCLGQQYTGEDVALLAAIADQIGSAIETAHLRAISKRAAVLLERHRLGRELHDSVTQSLYSISLMADAADQLASQGAFERARYYIQELGGSTRQALREMRLFINDLRPPDLKEGGVEEALRQRLEAVEKRSGISYTLAWQSGIFLTPRVEECLYWVSQEALNNILKHASATSIALAVSVKNDWVDLLISDNGVGFDPLESPENAGFGLKSIQERVVTFGGKTEVEAKPGQGVRLAIHIPLQVGWTETGSKGTYLFQKEKP